MTQSGKIILIGVIFSICFVFSGFAEPPEDDERSGQGRAVAEHPLFSGEDHCETLLRRPRRDHPGSGDPGKRWPSGGVQGWMHASALTTKTHRPARPGRPTCRQAPRAVKSPLPARGSAKRSRSSTRSLNRNLDYAWVDRMEKFQVSPEQMQAFLKQGNVVPAEGGVQ